MITNPGTISINGTDFNHRLTMRTNGYCSIKGFKRFSFRSDSDQSYFQIKLTEQQIQDNYMQVKLDVQLIIEKEMENLRALKKKQPKE